MRKRITFVESIPVTSDEESRKSKELQLSRARSHAASVSYARQSPIQKNTRQTVKEVDPFSYISFPLANDGNFTFFESNERQFLLPPFPRYIDRALNPSAYHQDGETSEVLHFRKLASSVQHQRLTAYILCGQ
jgi:hypothetical protein